MKVLVTGGAGHVGSVLCPLLLQKGHQVRVLDNLTFGANAVLGCFSTTDFELIQGDILNPEIVSKASKGVDLVVHLAAIVGYPACRRDEDLAYRINFTGTKNIANSLDASQGLIYASTSSNYGSVAEGVCTEDTPLNPISCYGKSKTESEVFVLANANAVALRFATAFGVSPRFRLDLMINDFVYQALHAKNLIVYEKAFKRSFIHVSDMARAILFAMDNFEKMKGLPFNIGSESMNYTKEDVALTIQKLLESEGKNFYLHFAEIAKDEDQRNYDVSYTRARELGFDTTITLEDGLKELIRAVPAINIRNPYSNAHV